MQIKPIIPKIKYEKLIYKVISAFLLYTFSDLEKVIEPIQHYYSNDISILTDAIQRQQIQYVNGYFYGQFDAKISKELVKIGATFDKRKKAFKIAREALPLEIINAIAIASLYAEALRKAILAVLNDINIDKLTPELKEVLDIPLDHIIDDLDDQTRTNFKKAISIVPDIPDPMRQELKKNYTEDITLSIKNFANEEIIELREAVEKNLFVGLDNNQSLIDFINKRFNVTMNKAKFLSRNETEILVAQYNLTRFKQMGIYSYIWDATMDQRTRPMHADLNGKVIDINDPPIVNEKGERKHAGMDYNCRCVMRPVL